MLIRLGEYIEFEGFVNVMGTGKGRSNQAKNLIPDLYRKAAAQIDWRVEVSGAPTRSACRYMLK